ncbi:MAG: phosphatase PAP2 family protein [Gemmatimonadaceae bacterium]
MQTIKAALIALALVHVGANAQERAPQSRTDSITVHVKPSWFSRRDLAHVGIAAGALGVLTLADEPTARFMQRKSLQQNQTLSHSADIIQVIGDPGALAISASLYVVGWGLHKTNLADASRHSVESIVASGAITQLLKLSVGRARPNVSQDTDALMFHPAHGSQTDFNSFPSGHTTASFAAASVFSAEIHRLHPKASKFATPALYGIATLVGGSRMYNDRHWLTDVAAGALIGHFVGSRIVARAHPRAK